MAVYNPYDQVVFDDPAYLTDADKAKEQIQEETRGIANIIARTAGPIAGLVTNSEKYQQTLDQEQRNRQILEQLGITNRQLNRDEMERAKAAGYVPLTTGQALGKISGFLYSDLVKGSENIRAGVDYYDLPENERMGVAMGIIDMADIAAIPAVFKKLATLGVKKFGKSNLKTMAQDPELQKQFPAETQEILSITGGGFTPAEVVREAEKGLGLASSTPKKEGIGKGGTYAGKGLPKDLYLQSYIKPEQARDIEKLADILNKTSIEDMNKPLKQIMVDNNLNSLLRVESKVREKEKIVPAQFVKQTLKRYKMVPEEKINKLTEITTKQPFRGGQQDKEAIQKFLEESLESGKTFNFEKDMAKEIGMTNSKFATILFRNPSLKKLSKDLIEDTSSFSVEKFLKKNKDELGLTAINSRGNKNDRYEYLLFDGLIRSLSAQDVGLKSGATRRAKTEKFIDYVKENIPDWKNVFREELNNLAYVDQQRNVANKTIKEMFKDYAERFPEQFKNENLNEYLLQVSHNYPLREDLRVFKGGGADIDSVRLAPSRTNNVHHAKIEKEVTKLKNNIDKQGSVSKAQMEKLKKLDQQAKELGTLIYTKIGDEYVAIGTEKAPGINTLVNSIEKYFQEISKRKGPGRVIKGEIIPLKFKEKQIKVKGKYGDVLEPRPFQKGGPVKMAIGGDPLANLNQQQFSADPAFEGEDYFSQAVESGNLQAFNPIRLFNIFGKPKGVVTPKDIEPTMLPSPGATDELTPAPISPVERNDFPFQSFTLEKMMSPNAPNAAKPQAWADFLMGGQQAPLSEIKDSGLEQFLRDYEKFFPDEKVTRQQLIDYYQESPIGNLNVIVKNENPRSIAEADELTPDQEDFVRYGNAMGLPKHKNAGSQPLDEVGENYRNVIVQAGSIPGESKAFVESSHFNDPNIIAFTRVADYAGSEGQKIAVIQELQTDMLTSLRKEQERIDAMLKRLDNAEQKLRIEAQSTDPYVSANAINRLEELNKMMSTQQKEILKETKGIKPFPNAAGKGLIPRYSEQLTGLQKLIDDEMKARVAQDMPYVDEKIFDISQQQLKIRDDLLDLNRALELDSLLKDIRVPGGRTSEEIARFGEESGLPSRYDTKELKLFGSVPFQKQKDYVDLILKATIKDAQSKGIEKVGIYPGKLVTQRWGKDIDGPEGKKFKDLYDRVAIQQMKSIAKKYGGTVDLEKIINPNLSDRGLTYYKRNLDGEYEYLKQDQLAQGLEPEEAQLFIDEQLGRNAHTLGANQVIYSKEIAPGQTMDYYVQPIPERVEMQASGEFSAKNQFELVPLSPGDDRNAAQILVEEYNPQEILIPVLTLPKTEKSAKPFFLYGKKDGGKISNDGLVSITDIYGDY